jgi:hypothetical protein
LKKTTVFRSPTSGKTLQKRPQTEQNHVI